MIGPVFFKYATTIRTYTVWHTLSPHHRPSIQVELVVVEPRETCCANRLLRCAVLGILMYLYVHCGSCAPCALHSGRSRRFQALPVCTQGHPICAPTLLRSSA